MLRYKADIYTHLGIFTGNEFDISPTVREYRKTSESYQRWERDRGRDRGGPAPRGSRGGQGGRGRAPLQEVSRGRPAFSEMQIHSIIPLLNRVQNADEGDGHQRQQRGRFESEGRVGRAMECANWRQKSNDDGDK